MTGRTVPPHPGLADGPIYLDYNATTRSTRARPTWCCRI
jgi:hypothetical protein